MSITGEPCALKGASTVRRGANGKGRMTYLASGLPNSCEDFQTTTVGDFAMAMFQTAQIEIHEVERALQSPRGRTHMATTMQISTPWNDAPLLKTYDMPDRSETC